MTSALCLICNKSSAKYRCPRCAARTCSVDCVREHKTLQNCSGVRDKTAYVGIKQFNDGTLLSDYTFLEDGSRKLHNFRRDKLRNINSAIPIFVRKLVANARRRNIHLVTLPFPLSKRRQNKTYFDFKQQKIYWQLELVFPQAGEETATLLTDREDETLTLGTVLLKYINGSHRQVLWRYSEQEPDNLLVFMVAEGRAARRQGQYWLLDVNKSINDNLCNKLIYEYPTMHVVYGSATVEYQEKSIKPQEKPAVSSTSVNAAVDQSPSDANLSITMDCDDVSAAPDVGNSAVCDTSAPVTLVTEAASNTSDAVTIVTEAASNSHVANTSTVSDSVTVIRDLVNEVRPTAVEQT